MATVSDLANRLLKKFKNVPNVTIEDATDWVTEAAYQHGYESPESVPDKETGLLLLLAQAEGARNIAVSVAHYFKYTDSEETVDKSMVSEQYRKLAKDLSEEYERKKAALNGATFKIARRADR
jgi:hypothetical protein